MIKLYYMPESPPCAAVLMLLEHLQLQFEHAYLDLFKKEQLEPAFKKVNPLHCVPTLVDNGVTIWESRAILAYLINQYASSEQAEQLYPKDALKRAQIDSLLYFDIGSLYNSQSKYLKPLLQKKSTDDEGEQDFRRYLTFLDDQLKHQTHLVGDHITLADISVLGSLQFSKAARFNFEEYKHLSDWLVRMAEWPAYKKVCLEPLSRFQAFLDQLKSA